MTNLSLVPKGTRPLIDQGTDLERLSERIIDRFARIVVIGQGDAGLTLASEFAGARFRVIGLDIDRDRVRKLNRGESLTPDVSDKSLLALRNSGYYEASWDFSVLRNAEVILICVPAFLHKSGDPDISYLRALDQVVLNLCPGQLIIFESTSYSSTTEELLPIFEAKGYVAGEDVFLAFPPARINPGIRKFMVKNIAKVNGGVTPACAKLAALLYRQIVDRVV